MKALALLAMTISVIALGISINNDQERKELRDEYREAYLFAHAANKLVIECETGGKECELKAVEVEL